ncbi:TNT domain-containing protein [Actinosynnema sp. NPDC020468]|uniref:TNT domain-containing protein n=1 Tax=Actinosynnema sp. NPDC020468 TaxID=3154488 RepID=UPI0033FA0F76
MTPRKHVIPFLVLLSAALGLVTTPVAQATPPPVADAPPVCDKPFYQDDERLGPKDLPSESSVVGRLLIGYQRFGNEATSQDFLARYWDSKGWIYPDHDGFEGTPTAEKLQPGKLVDRFGGQSGRFLSTTGTPLVQRSVPPQSLNTCEYEPGVKQPYGYYQYKVEKEFEVLAGTSAKGFGQPGGGPQYKVSSPNPPERRNVAWLVTNGYLSVVK